MDAKTLKIFLCFRWCWSQKFQHYIFDKILISSIWSIFWWIDPSGSIMLKGPVTILMEIFEMSPKRDRLTWCMIGFHGKCWSWLIMTNCFVMELNASQFPPITRIGDKYKPENLPQRCKNIFVFISNMKDLYISWTFIVFTSFHISGLETECKKVKNCGIRVIAWLHLSKSACIFIQPDVPPKLFL